MRRSAWCANSTAISSSCGPANIASAAEDPFPRRDLDAARNVGGGSPAWCRFTRRGRIFFWKDPVGDKSYLIQAFAFDPDQSVFLLPEVNEQRDRLKQEDSCWSGPPCPAVPRNVGRRARDHHQWPNRHIAGSFALGPDFMSSGTVLMSDRTFAGLLTGNRDNPAALPVEFGVVKVQPGGDIAAVQQALTTALPKEVRVFEQAQLIAFERDFQADLVLRGPIFWMGTFVGFIVGMLISYQVIYTDLSDQLPQYATLKGMGYDTGYLVRIVFEQAALSAIIAFVPAWLLCLLVYYVIGVLALLPLHMTLALTCSASP